MLGDMDTYVLERADVWATPTSLARKEPELVSLQARVQAKVDAFFPDFTIKVRRWSEFYSKSQADPELRRSQDVANWQNWDGLFEQSKMMYLDQWKYRAIAARMGIAENQIVDFIRGDLIRTAAQYAVEREIIRGLGAIQAWAEAVPCWDWPLWVSHYDRSAKTDALIPSLFLTR